LPQTVGGITISDEPRGRHEGRRDMATKDKRGSKSRRKGPARPTIEAPNEGGETSMRNSEVVRRLQVDDTARAARAAPRGSRHVGVVAIRALGLSRFT
jgi:hypothetical protein